MVIHRPCKNFLDFKGSFKKIFLKHQWFNFQGQPKICCKPAHKYLGKLKEKNNK